MEQLAGRWFVLRLYALFSIVAASLAGGPEVFIAAVYEHPPYTVRTPSPPVSREFAVNHMMRNIGVYEEKVREAKEKNASIIVFPEYGITGMGFPSREAFAPFLEDMPDPQQVTWTPCNQTSANGTHPVLYTLSCLARQNEIYIVANAGDLKKCSRTTDRDCPSNGQYQYNTNIAFDSEGRFIARYHKQYPFMGERVRVDVPKEPEYVTFQTPFGKFGTFICFDVLFHEPAVTLIEKYSVDHVVFPTAWFDQIPLFAAIGFHGSWGRGMDVNFLSSNTHIPVRNSTGTGLYSPERDRAYYRNTTSPEGKLLVSSLPVNPKRQPSHRQKKSTDVITTVMNILREADSEASDKDRPFFSELFGDLFLFKTVQEQNGSASLCYNTSQVCCSVSYSMENVVAGEMYALGVFDGLHTKEGQYYLQICVFLKCQTQDKQLCGKKVDHAQTVFTTLHLSGTFGTKYIFPQVITDGVTLAPGEWEYGANWIRVERPMSKGLVTAALFGRKYEWDAGVSIPNLGSRKVNSLLLLILIQVALIIIKAAVM